MEVAIKKLQKVLANIVPEGSPASKNNACDLGCQVTYYGNPQLGSMHQRFAKAKKRLLRLKHLRWDLTLKKTDDFFLYHACGVLWSRNCLHRPVPL